jgi:serine phosphatase RsbU (regulator of sigma subunit)
LGLQGKFVVALLISAALPFLIGLVVFETSGYRYFLDERGKFNQFEASTLARALDQAADVQGEVLQTWLAADPTLLGVIAAKNRQADGQTPADLSRTTRELDELWPSLPADDPRVTAVLANPACESLRKYLALHQEVAEILATDAEGRLVAATGKSSDFDQADEEWWWEGAALGQNERWADVLHFDASSGVYSLDVVMPLHEDGKLAGVVKMSVDVSALFSGLDFNGKESGEQWEIVLADGWILASSQSGFVPLQKQITAKTREMLQHQTEGWFLGQEKNGDARMTGYVTMGRGRKTPAARVMFSSRRDDVIATLQQKFLEVALAAAAVLAICTAAGFCLIRRNILLPLATLGRAARSISDTARFHPPEARDELEVQRQRDQAEHDLGKIEAIRTGDEIETLAGDLAVMTSRVLRYHRELEAEVAAKTSVIHDELEMARQFQTALLPSRYPEVPSATTANPLRLRFAHFYQPASTVGGDFFDLIELDEHRAGILIADVMGHGARSALITAILRALVRNHTVEASDPGVFLGELNRHLQEVISHSGQTLFVTAFFLVLDTRNCSATWAVAGHPAPLRVRRGSGRAPEPLWNEPHHQPALGLVSQAAFRTCESTLLPGDVFLLFTDGAFEAENPAGEMFGIERLAKSLDEALDGPMAAMPAKIVCDVTDFQRRQYYDDDVCIVAVEAVSRSVST